MSRLILFIFAGRRENMMVQKPYLDRILRTYPEAELHLWDLTRNPGDAKYLDTLEGAHKGRVRVLRHLHPGHPIRCGYPRGYEGKRPRGYPRCECVRHKPPYEKPYQWYAEQEEYEGTVYVKMDDDVLFLETRRFDDLLAPVVFHPNRIVSANVINNVVCAKYQPDAQETANWFMVGDPASSKNDRRWWALHTDPDFARWCHDKFLAQATSVRQPTYVRTRPGEAVSINCIAFSHQTMKRLATSFVHEPTLGDEGAVDRMLPWICTSFHAAHLTFGPQDTAMSEAELSLLRKQYGELAKGYLS